VLIEGPAVLAGGSFAQMFAIVIHELATNATKYGALSVPDGRVHIRWSITGGTFEFSWVERGGPPVRSPAAPGFGSQLINAALGAKPHFAFASRGLEYAVRLPLSEVLSAQQGTPGPSASAEGTHQS
jgi:two-component sensor histidine kinase